MRKYSNHKMFNMNLNNYKVFVQSSLGKIILLYFISTRTKVVHKNVGQRWHMVRRFYSNKTNKILKPFHEIKKKNLM